MAKISVHNVYCLHLHFVHQTALYMHPGGVVIDILCVLVFAYGVYVGFTKGILQTLFSIIILVIALIGSMWFTPIMSELIKSNVKQEIPHTQLSGIAFVLSFVLAFFVVKLIGRAIEDIVQNSKVPVFNRGGGAVLLGIFFLFLFSALLRFGAEAGMVGKIPQRDSKLYQYVVRMPQYGFDAIRYVLPLLQDFWSYTHGENVKDGVIEDTRPSLSPIPPLDYSEPDRIPTIVPDTVMIE